MRSLHCPVCQAVHAFPLCRNPMNRLHTMSDQINTFLKQDLVTPLPQNQEEVVKLTSNDASLSGGHPAYLLKRPRAVIDLIQSGEERTFLVWQLMALFHCMVRHGTVHFWGVFHWVLYLVPDTFLVPLRSRFHASRTVTKT